MRKKIALIAASAGAVGILALAGMGAVSAEGQNGSSLVDKIAQHFNLNKEDVQKVFDEAKDERQAEHEQKLKDKLDQAVKDGKMTQAQADQIVAKLKELKDFRTSLKDKTPQERHEALKDKRDELRQWAKDNNIPLRYLMPLGGPHPDRGHDGPGDGPMDQ